MNKLVLSLAAALLLMPGPALAGKPGGQAPPVPNSVCIDPGHGGSDGGASNGGIREADLNLQVADKLGAVLTNNGYTVWHTRTTDVALSNADRYNFCNSKNAAILVSVHHNGSTNPDVDYSLALYSKRADVALARAVVDAVTPATTGQNNGISRFQSGVLLKSNMPATISEGYFLTSSAELAKLNDTSRDYRQEEAQAIYQGIVNYFAAR